jgi:hypothetical protein
MVSAQDYCLILGALSWDSKQQKSPIVSNRWQFPAQRMCGNVARIAAAPLKAKSRTEHPDHSNEAALEGGIIVGRCSTAVRERKRPARTNFARRAHQMEAQSSLAAGRRPNIDGKKLQLPYVFAIQMKRTASKFMDAVQMAMYG